MTHTLITAVVSVVLLSGCTPYWYCRYVKGPCEPMPAEQVREHQKWIEENERKRREAHPDGCVADPCTYGKK